MPNIGDVILSLVIFIFSLSVREAVRAYTASRLGDDTARMLGRVTLNPLAHADPLGTFLFPIIGAIRGGIFVGWAKPIPFDPSRSGDRRRAIVMFGLSGILANLLLGVLFLVILKALMMSGLIGVGLGGGPFGLRIAGEGLLEPIGKLLSTGMVLNLFLAVFHLFPIPPLDMGEVLVEFLPYEAARSFEQIRPFGFFIILGISLLGVFGIAFRPVLIAALLFLAL